MSVIERWNQSWTVDEANPICGISCSFQILKSFYTKLKFKFLKCFILYAILNEIILEFDYLYRLISNIFVSVRFEVELKSIFLQYVEWYTINFVFQLRALHKWIMLKSAKNMIKLNIRIQITFLFLIDEFDWNVFFSLLSGKKVLLEIDFTWKLIWWDSKSSLKSFSKWLHW